jgi:hypothetical protein
MLKRRGISWLFHWLRASQEGVAFQPSFESWIRTGTYKCVWDNRIWPGQVDAVAVVEAGVWEYIASLGMCSREVQLRIYFGLACCHILFVVNLFYPLKATNAGGLCPSETLSPVHNMTRLGMGRWRQSFVRLIRLHIRLSQLTVQLL